MEEPELLPRPPARDPPVLSTTELPKPEPVVRRAALPILEAVLTP